MASAVEEIARMAQKIPGSWPGLLEGRRDFMPAFIVEEVRNDLKLKVTGENCTIDGELC